MARSYLFYDLETSGLNKCFDQVIQFAAIRTDENLQELERYEFWIKPNFDLVPAPQAFLTHKIELDRLHHGWCEYEAMCEIHRLLNTPDTITVGYNNLGFDDEFLRFSFYRNLLEPYTHQYANRCGRMDIYPMLIIYYLYKSRSLIWPEVSEQVSFKLEHLAQANDLACGMAHDAMSDVQATLALAKRMRGEQSVWDHLVRGFDKQIDMNRLERLPSSDLDCQEGLLIDGSFGYKHAYQSQAIYLGHHYYYHNQLLWLPIDRFSLTAILPSDYPQTTFVIRKRFGELPIILPPLDRFSRYLPQEQKELAAANRAWLKQQAALIAGLANYHRNRRYPEIPNLDLDASLYQLGFWNEQERQACRQFHAVKLEQKLSMSLVMSSPRLRQQAIRILGRNYHQLLETIPALWEKFTEDLAHSKTNGQTVDYQGNPVLSSKAALEEIEQLLTNSALTQIDRQIITKLAKYIQSRPSI